VVSGLDVKNIIELAKTACGDNSLLIIVNKIGNKANIVVCSKSDYKADEVAKRLSKELGGGAHGSPEIAVGGGAADRVDDVIARFRL
jgi:alanyl-tRNA synthetase